MHQEEGFLWRSCKHQCLVFVFFISFIVLTILPLWHQVGAQPVLWLIILYHWGLYRQDLLRIEQLILISLIQDGLYAYPLGFSALRLLIDYALLTTQGRIISQQTFLWVWGGFGLFVFLDSFIYTGLLSCVKSQWIGTWSLIPGLIMTIGFYPLIVLGINRLMMKFFPR